MPTPHQATAFDTVTNARDIGGLTGAGGRPIRHQKLYRSGNPGLASSADQDRLHALKLDAIVDFRSSSEKSTDELAFAQRFNWVALPLLEGSMSMEVLLPRLRDSTPEQVHGMMLEIYRDFATRGRDAFGAFLQLAQSGQTLLFHCTAGKDRTGFAAMLLQTALGVSQDDILANYLESNARNQGFIDKLVRKFAEHGVERDVVMPLLEVREDYLLTAVAAIEAEWGSVEAYLQEVMQVDIGVVRGHYLAG